jgi:hypothetical protein
VCAALHTSSVIQWWFFPEPSGPHQPPALTKVSVFVRGASSSLMLISDRKEHLLTLRIAPSVLLSNLVLVALCLAAAGWIGAVPSIVSASTFVFSMVFLVSAGGVTLMAWQNAMATSTVGQLLYATEIAETSRRTNDYRQ